MLKVIIVCGCSYIEWQLIVYVFVVVEKAVVTGGEFVFSYIY
jgi:predicted metal-binding membrane protein